MKRRYQYRRWQYFVSNVVDLPTSHRTESKPKGNTQTRTWWVRSTEKGVVVRYIICSPWWSKQAMEQQISNLPHLRDVKPTTSSHGAISLIKINAKGDRKYDA
jgi:hypothetical protein